MSMTHHLHERGLSLPIRRPGVGHCTHFPFLILIGIIQMHSNVLPFIFHQRFNYILTWAKPRTFDYIK